MAKTKRATTKADPPQFSKLSVRAIHHVCIATWANLLRAFWQRTRSDVSATDLGAAARKQPKRDPEETENQPPSTVLAAPSRVTRSRATATRRLPSKAANPVVDSQQTAPQPACTQATTRLAPVDDFADAASLASIFDGTGVEVSPPRWLYCSKQTTLLTRQLDRGTPLSEPRWLPPRPPRHSMPKTTSRRVGNACR